MRQGRPYRAISSVEEDSEDHGDETPRTVIPLGVYDARKEATKPW